MSKNVILVVVLIALVIFVFTFSQSGVSEPKPAATPTETQKTILDRSIDINDVVNDPPVYKDLVLTLEGRINNWVTKYAFTITPSKSNFASSGKTLPIITRNNFILPEDTPENELALGEVANIRVTGKIIIFDRATLERDWHMDLDDKEMDRWNKSPVLLVDKIEKI